MQCVVGCGAAVPWAMQVGPKRRHVVSASSQRTALAAAREFVQLRKHKTTSPDRFSSLFFEPIYGHTIWGRPLIMIPDRLRTF